jgi:hypothetical protein
MNDFMEAQHGRRCLMQTYESAPGEQLRKLLTPHFATLFPRLDELLDGWTSHFLTDTYLTCVSEHLPEEDRIGRLSMWRAYGAGSGVALVMNNKPFLSETDALHAYSSPVAYLDADAFADAFSAFVENVSRHIEILRNAGEQEVLNWLFSMMRYAVVSTKHPGFAEEREWRVIHSPKLEPSARLVCNVEIVRGIPQKVYKIPLRNVPEEGFTGAEIPELLERIIIGPTEFPLATADALHLLLEKAGVPDAGSRIVISDIPLRTF